jgi:uncharacterized radical SAM superfamily protein
VRFLEKEKKGYWAVSYPIDEFYEEIKKIAESLDVDVKTFVKEAIVEKVERERNRQVYK